MRRFAPSVVEFHLRLVEAFIVDHFFSLLTHEVAEPRSRGTIGDIVEATI
jgi:hypothetical protein